jgi:hypothetical protein
VSGAINRVTANGVGILGYGGNASVTIIDAVANNNSYGIGASSPAVMVRNSTVRNNAIGIAATKRPSSASASQPLRQTVLGQVNIANRSARWIGLDLHATQFRGKGGEELGDHR